MQNLIGMQEERGSVKEMEIIFNQVVFTLYKLN